MIRIGHAWDTHKLVEGRKLILGGVEIEHIKGCLGHSDADVLLHAIAEAILGALALGDLLIEENKPFDAECNQLVWQWNDEKGCVIYKVDDDAYHPDIADSVKYAWNTYITDRNAGA